MHVDLAFKCHEPAEVCNIFPENTFNMDALFNVAIICLVFVFTACYLFKRWLKKLLERCVFGSKLQKKKGVVILYQVGRGPRAPSVSPFPLKLETFLRMANIPYMNDHNGWFSSKGKTPWMEYEGVAVADSQFCIEYLKRERCMTLDQCLTEGEKAVARAIQKMTEENLYWTMCSETFFKESSESELESLLPYGPLKRRFVLKTLKYVLRKEMWGHGIGRHTPEEIWQIGEADLKAISDILGNKAFFMGAEPTEVDCSMFGMLAQVRWHMRGSKHEKRMLEKLPNLVDYCERMKERFWPDWNKRITSSDQYQNDHGHLYNQQTMEPKKQFCKTSCVTDSENNLVNGNIISNTGDTWISST